MKKQVTLLAVLAAFIVSMQVKAQYFQYLYGTQSKSELLSDGHNTSIGGNVGHVLIGPSPFFNNFGNEFAITMQRTDQNGTTTSPGCFNNMYTITDIAFPVLAINTNLVMRDAHSVELADQSGYAIAGAWVGGANQPLGVFFGIVDPNGNPLMLPVPAPANAVGIYPSSGSYIDIRVNSIIESQKNPGNLYICGHLTEAVTRYNKVFAIKIDQNGAIAWSRIYDLDGYSSGETATPFDMIESPYVDPVYGLDQFVIVGRYQDLSTAANQPKGFVLKIDDIYGNMFNPVKLYGDAASASWFSSVTASSNPNIDPNGEGFVIAGQTNQAGHFDVWSLAMDNNDNIAWSETYNYMSGGPTANNDFNNDIMERINTMGLSEYYLAGYTDQGVFGTEDVLVFKIDDNGNAVAGGQFTYGDIDADRGIRIDKLEGMGPNMDGIAVFSYGFFIPPNTIGGFDHYLIKAYFNGVVPCYADQQDADQHPGPQYFDEVNGDNVTAMSDFYMRIDAYSPLDEYQLCFTQSDPDGSNARLFRPDEVAPVQEHLTPGTQSAQSGKLRLVPNPVSENPAQLGLKYTAESNGKVRLVLRDAMGRQLLDRTVEVSEGENLLQFDVSELRLSQALYFLTVSGDQYNETLRLRVIR